MNLSALSSDKQFQEQLIKSLFRFGFKEKVEDISPLLVTSSVRGEGKTTLALGMGMAIASLMNRRCVLWDMNWDTPTLTTALQSKRHMTYDDFLTSDVASVIQDTHLPKLGLVSSLDIRDMNRPTSQLLDTFKSFVTKLKLHADFIIIDGPAVKGAIHNDPIFLASLAQSCFLVIKGRSTDKRLVKGVTMSLKGVNSNIGAVMNNFDNIFYA